MPRSIPMTPTTSSSITAAGYDAVTATLRVRFVRGRTYDYIGVPADAYDAFLAAPSKGRFVNFEIKPYYPVQRLDI